MRDLDGVVLAGGRSRRLGMDKAMLTFGHQSLIQITIEALSGVCRSIVLVRNSRQPNINTHALTVNDAYLGQGPLAGIEAGLRAIHTEFAFVVACDMPFLNRDLLVHMASLPDKYQVLVPRIGGCLHPLHAVYSKYCLPLVQHQLASGHNSVSEFLSLVSVRTVEEDEVRRFDPDGLSLFNLNERSDLAKAQALWRARELPALRDD